MPTLEASVCRMKTLLGSGLQSAKSDASIFLICWKAVSAAVVHLTLSGRSFLVRLVRGAVISAKLGMKWRK